jgi:hypothetical protein
MAINTHMCGIKSCSDILQGMVLRMGWQAVGCIAIIAVVCPNLLVMLHRCILNWSPVRPMSIEDGYRKKGSAPYYQDLDVDECSSLHRRKVPNTPPSSVICV